MAKAARDAISSVSKSSSTATIRLDLNNPVFQKNLFALPKPDRHAVLDTLDKLRQLTWNQVYRGSGLKWEKLLA